MTARVILIAVLLGLAELCIIFAGRNVGATLMALIPMMFAIVLAFSLRRV